MTRIRVLHIPSHIAYVHKLHSHLYSPVTAPGSAPFTIDQLLKLDDWRFFDVLHLHTVELASIEQVRLLSARLRAQCKGLVFTAHDLAPNIEADGKAFQQKMRLAMRLAHTVITLTTAAVERINRTADQPRSLCCLPHGSAGRPAGSANNAPGILAFGALRPNRDFGALVRAWRTLDPVQRPPLRLLLRSVGPADVARNRALLTELQTAVREEPDCTVAVTDTMVAPDELATWCAQGSVLALPYRHITHSGQLELARDLGLAAVAPDAATVRAQLTDTGDETTPVVWARASALASPGEYAGLLRRAIAVERNDPFDHTGWQAYREREHRELLDAHARIYKDAKSAATEWNSI
ncbi:glycosyltransferase involved in cell wall biosynthesis [Murinocardiopsis flavida]|uniref:Glycosyltransferase involved in cell wall biosynthesis n=1 Tax=Murinocardiopsis flavida TaxID=645275 RepID=A0A2P8DG56_9ACTN|nr:glycosyltransferase family 4 protein [Murinocardiopsis flavida]PSK96179.1 glycosyltransferase involved in cell wall biosynthesis [Murinocardiopsis flavida]